MAYLTLSFHGLCAFVYNDDNPEKLYEVILPTEMGHRATLMARTEFLDPNNTTWEPDFIGGVETNAAPAGAKVDQIAGWYLTGRVTFSGPSANAVDWPSRGADAIDFKVFHSGSKLKPMPPRPVAPVVVLPGGTGSCPRKHAITLKKSGVPVPGGSKDFGTVVEWEGLPTVMQNDHGGQIQFIVDKRNRDPFATVTNVAAAVHAAMPGMPASKAGLDHFKAYYLYVDLAPGDPQIDLAAALGEVYDCVPPAPIS